VQSGVITLRLPAAEHIHVPTNDVYDDPTAGLGDRPPRLDDPARAARLVAWLRLRPTAPLAELALRWVGINAVEIEQRQTITGRVIGQSDGTADQELTLPATSVDRASLAIEVEDGAGYEPWRVVDDLALAGRDDAVLALDAEAGTIRFGDGVRGRIPVAGERVRVALLRAGGGAAGNLAPRVLASIAALDLEGRAVPGLKVLQSVPTGGGADAETLADAERRIPALLRHGDRAVTADDFRRLTGDTPGAAVGRVEVLPRFLPRQRRSDVPGVVSVMALPQRAVIAPPNPRPDRPFLETVFAWLDARRPLATELYVIGCEYVAIGVGVGITVRDGFGREAVANDVRAAIFQHLWPLAPGGVAGTGWPLGRAVRDREIDVVVARVAGVDTVAGVSLFTAARAAAPPAGATVLGGASAPPKLTWSRVSAAERCAPVQIDLLAWQLPELLEVTVDTDGVVPTDLHGGPPSIGGDPGIAVPLVPEVC
jgi:predicted phage baseplate assembly protein